MMTNVDSNDDKCLFKLYQMLTQMMTDVDSQDAVFHCQVFDNFLKRGQRVLVRDWVMLSLSNFTQRTPVAMAIWSLTCFFVSASTNPWIRSLYPLLQAFS